MADVSAPNKKDSSLDLPPGFRFHPTDEEIITHYLCNKVMDSRFTATAIGEVDLNKCEPWDLPSRAKMGEKEYYFFCQRDRKYPTGMRTNRATEAGYWKATGKDKEIFRGKGVLVGMKKTLVFYTGRAPKGEKTNWVMHEFRLEGKHVFINLPRSTKDEWVVSKVFHKNNIMGIKKMSPMDGIMRMNSFELPDSPLLPPLMDTSFLASFDLKGNIPASSSPMPSFMMMEELQAPYFPVPSTGFYPTPQTPYFPLGPAGSSYLNQDTSGLAMRRHCKVEQLSGQSMLSPSQDTGASTDRNTETGSGYSYVDDLDDPTSAEAVIDFDNMWKF